MHLLLDNDFGMGAAVGASIATILMIVSLVALFMVVCQWMIYTKAGKPGWAAIVPIYNMIVLLEIVGKPWWWLILMLIPIVNIVIIIMVLNLLSKSFGQGVGFTLGLLFVGIVFYPLMAFSKNIKYVGPAGAAAAPQA